MADPAAQQKWRDKHRFTKTQLNVMARKHVHGYLEDFAGTFSLRGKAEAVAFCAFATKMLMQHGEHNPEAKRLMTLIADAFHRDRDLFQP
ncbi:MAG: hypothetical protein A2516_11930 [Alphaproteobacteria bacterium RIFOXYD12_FULL_60_8]|nr:MAG: hypothetical protein A2516_11930 [Alphaproteobacteria bacterium RIFOXYD12_FULL_60_8]